MKKRVIKQDEIFVVSGGVYDSYQLFGSYRAIRKFNVKDIFLEYFRDYPEQNDEYMANFRDFTQWLLDKEYAVRTPVQELHLGGHGTFDTSLYKLEAYDNA